MPAGPSMPVPDRLRAAIAALRPIERDALLLSVSGSLSVSEIAERLGITPEAAERHLSDALVALDRHLHRRQGRRRP